VGLIKKLTKIICNKYFTFEKSKYEFPQDHKNLYRKYSILKALRIFEALEKI